MEEDKERPRKNKVVPEDVLKKRVGVTFDSAMDLPLQIGYFLSFVPVGNKAFSWLSIRCFTALLVIVGNVIMAGFSIIWILQFGLSIKMAGRVLFSCGAAACMALFIRLAIKWQHFLTNWRTTETYFGCNPNLRLKFVIISLLIFTSSAVVSLGQLANRIVTNKELSADEILRKHCEALFQQVFHFIEYTHWRMIPILLIKFIATFGYSCADQIVIMSTLALGDLFQVFNEKMAAANGQVIGENTWRALRTDYTRLCNLTKDLDDCLCYLLLLSCSKHIYQSLLEMRQDLLSIDLIDTADKISLRLSLTVSLVQACAVCMCCVRIYEQSRLPLQTLYSVPSVSFTDEVERFTQQIIRGEISITAGRFFSMKRSVLLKVFGTMATYEVFLIQLNQAYKTTY